MRALPAAAIGLLLAAAPLRSESAKECVDLTARIDNDVSSPSGVRVTIAARNHCQEDVNGSKVRFQVRALGPGNAVIATQRGKFGGSIAPRELVETKVFVVCDPDRIRSVTVEAN
jgi:hypothetical protein